MKKMFTLIFFVTTIIMTLSWGLCDKVQATEIIDSGSCGTNVTYTLDSDGILEISGNGDMKNYSDSTSAPWDSYRSNIKKAIIYDGVTSIGEHMFRKCDSLISVIIPDSITSIGYKAFYKCDSLISVAIPDSVTGIGGYAFYNCSSLTSVTIGDGVTSIRGYAFHECSNLEGVYITDLVAWCNIRFADVYANPLRYAKKIYINRELVTELIIPDNVTSIEDLAFEYCSSLKSVMIHDSMKSIGSATFYGCSGLESVYITDIEAWCNIDFGDKWANPLYHANKLYVNNKRVVNVDIPSGVKQIPTCAFSCDSIENITIPDSVQNIDSYAFYSCDNLISVMIGNSVTSIGGKAFYGCSSLTSVMIPDSVMSIGANAFEDCSSLKSITIGNSVTSIGEKAFQGCSSLTNVMIPDGVMSMGIDVFVNCSGLKSVMLGNNMTSIVSRTFYNCGGLTTIIIPDTVYEIGNYAFSDCNSLSVIEYGGSETEWSEVYIGSGNDSILNAEIRFNSALASNPAENELEVKQVESAESGVYTFSILPEKVASGCFVYAAAYSEEDDVRKLIGISKTELLTDGETKINVNKDDAIDFVVMFVWRGENNPISQTGKVNISQKKQASPAFFA